MHSAALMACQIAGITLFQKRNLTFIMEGSLFWEEIYRQEVEQFLPELVSSYKVSFDKIADSTIVGAAKLVS